MLLILGHLNTLPAIITDNVVTDQQLARLLVAVAKENYLHRHDPSMDVTKLKFLIPSAANATTMF